MRASLVLVFAVLIGCSKAPSGAVTLSPTPSASSSSTPETPIVKATSCPAGSMTYLGFRGTGQPPPALLREIRARFPDALVVEVEPDKLGVVIAEPHSMDVRARHEAAASAVGWKGDVVDFPTVARNCTLTFHTPMPPPK